VPTSDDKAPGFVLFFRSFCCHRFLATQADSRTTKSIFPLVHGAGKDWRIQHSNTSYLAGTTSTPSQDG